MTRKTRCSSESFYIPEFNPDIVRGWLIRSLVVPRFRVANDIRHSETIENR
jgi:hypothetical protein